jgi:hypothetical protein
MGKSETICQCEIPEIELDNSCGKCSFMIPLERILQIEKSARVETNPTVEVNIENRSALDNRKITELLINQLTNSKKYKRAIKSGEFAKFSLIGTEDWEDYASLALRAQTLLTLTSIDKNIEEIRNILDKNK